MRLPFPASLPDITSDNQGLDVLPRMATDNISVGLLSENRQIFVGFSSFFLPGYSTEIAIFEKILNALIGQLVWTKKIYRLPDFRSRKKGKNNQLK